jgi:hypothetical protein
MSLLFAIALITGGLFAGTCLYVLVVAHPVRLCLSDAVALQIYRASLVRSERMQPPLHASCLAATLGICLLEPAVLRWSALLVLAPILPLSLIVILPLNRALEAPELEADPARARPLLSRWGRLHGVRTVLAGLGYCLLVLSR